MRQYLRTLTPTTQFAVVIAIAFGLFIFHGVTELLQLRPPGHLSETGFRSLLVHEAVVMTALAIFLRGQGWTLQDFGLRLTAKQAIVEILLGVALALVVYLLYVAVWRLASALFTVEMTRAAIVHRGLVVSRIDLTTAVAVSVVNSFFEEMFGCGFAISSLERARWPIWAAIAASVAVRQLCHVYQGVVGLVAVLPTGIVFGYWYARSKLLLPVIVAHGLLDIFSLLHHVAG